MQMGGWTQMKDEGVGLCVRCPMDLGDSDGYSWLGRWGGPARRRQACQGGPGVGLEPIEKPVRAVSSAIVAGPGRPAGL